MYYPRQFLSVFAKFKNGTIRLNYGRARLPPPPYLSNLDRADRERCDKQRKMSNLSHDKRMAMHYLYRNRLRKLSYADRRRTEVHTPRPYRNSKEQP